MAKVQIKSEKLTPFGGIFSIMEQFDSMLSPIIDSTLGQRCRQYHRIPVQRNYSFSDERILLWRFMRGGCNIASDASSLVSSDLAHMQL